MTIASKLSQISGVKSDIKDAIEAKGVDMTNVPLTDYASRVLLIGGTTTGVAITADATQIGTVQSDLTQLANCKTDIKNAIEAKGVSMTGVAFTGYAAKILEIPTVQLEPYLTFTAKAPNSTVQIQSPQTNYPIQYSRDGVNWTNFTTNNPVYGRNGAVISGGTGTEQITLQNTGDFIQVRVDCEVAGGCTWSGHFYCFGDIGITGRLKSLASKNIDNSSKVYGSTFKVFGTFQGQTGGNTVQDITSVDIELPKLWNSTSPTSEQKTFNDDTIGANMCYGLFLNNIRLTSAKITFESDSVMQYTSYQSMNSMFQNCTSLIDPPDWIPQGNSWGTNNGTSMSYSRKSMFQGCTSLTRTPLIKGMRIGRSVYARNINPTAQNMFYNCTSLTDLYVSDSWVYSESPYNSSTVVYCCQNWMTNVSSTGTIHMPTGTYTGFDSFLNNRGVSGAPANWTTVNDIDV